MKYLDHLQVLDDDILAEMSTNTDLHAQSELAQYRGAIEAAYEAYRIAGGSQPPYHPWLPESLRDAMKSQYGSPCNALKGFIHFTRHRLSPGVCSVCGAASSATLDHVYPKSSWPVFSFFSLNLVPACDQCNRKKDDNFFSHVQGARPVHPYYDTFLKQRVALAQLVPPYSAPVIDVVPDPTVAPHVLPIIEWHLENVVRKTQIRAALTERWHNICRDPGVFYEGLAFGATMNHAVHAKLGSLDAVFQTPNNWESMLQAGIARDQDAQAFLAACYAAPKENPL